MSEHQIIKVKNGGDLKSFALYNGLPTDELINLLVAAFGVYNATIVGFQTEVSWFYKFKILKCISNEHALFY